MREELRRGAELFNAGHWWEAHEAWEGEWQKASGQERQYIQALILLAAALHKRWVHGSPSHRNFYKAQRYLAALPRQYDDLNLHALEAEVWAALQTPDQFPQLPLGQP